MYKTEKKKVKCAYCLGCNKLECKDFKGVMECDNFIPGIETCLEICKRILKGEQIEL